MVAAAEVSDWAKEVDSRMTAAVERGDASAAGAGFLDYIIPSKRGRWVRRLFAPWIGRRLLSGINYPVSDILVETEAELAFDSRSVLPDIAVPVVLLYGDRDRCFTPDVVDETVRLIPDCTQVRYAGQGHVKVATSRRVPRDVLKFVDRR